MSPGISKGPMYIPHTGVTPLVHECTTFSFLWGAHRSGIWASAPCCLVKGFSPPCLVSRILSVSIALLPAVISLALVVCYLILWQKLCWSTPVVTAKEVGLERSICHKRSGLIHSVTVPSCLANPMGPERERGPSKQTLRHLHWRQVRRSSIPAFLQAIVPLVDLLKCMFKESRWEVTHALVHQLASPHLARAQVDRLANMGSIHPGQNLKQGTVGGKGLKAPCFAMALAFPHYSLKGRVPLPSHEWAREF